MSETAPWAEKQPRDGETILHCPHMDGNKFQWFMMPAYMDFTRPDGTAGRSRWLAQCPACMLDMPTNGPTIAGDSTWIGNEPAIKDVRG